MRLFKPESTGSGKGQLQEIEAGVYECVITTRLAAAAPAALGMILVYALGVHWSLMTSLGAPDRGGVILAIGLGLAGFTSIAAAILLLRYREIARVDLQKNETQVSRRFIRNASVTSPLSEARMVMRPVSSLAERLWRALILSSKLRHMLDQVPTHVFLGVAGAEAPILWESRGFAESARERADALSDQIGVTCEKGEGLVAIL